LSIPEFTHILDAVEPYTQHLYFHIKGEPLLHPLVEELAALAHGRGFLINLTTNGDLLNRHPGLMYHLRQLNVSLHGHTDPEMLVNRILELPNPQNTKICLRLWDGGKNTRAAALPETLFGVSDKKTSRSTLRENLYVSRAERFEWPSLSRPPLHPNGYCHGLTQQVGILASGDVVPCCLDGEGNIPLGNIFAQSLSEILSSKRAEALREGFRRRVVSEALCRTCSYKNRFRRNHI